MLVAPPVVLGHRRLSILDLSAAGHQPMSSPDGRLWITYNGEIYNFLELQAELQALGHEFRTTCDTEVLLTAYAHWGAEALHHLNGMFAFAVWDRERQELFCARDRFGVKPFYYTVVDGRFRFASEIKALFVDEAVQRRANDARVTDFLAFGYTDHTAETLFEGVLQLPPGSFFVVEHGTSRPGTDAVVRACRGRPRRCRSGRRAPRPHRRCCCTQAPQRRPGRHDGVRWARLVRGDRDRDEAAA